MIEPSDARVDEDVHIKGSVQLRFEAYREEGGRPVFSEVLSLPLASDPVVRAALRYYAELTDSNEQRRNISWWLDKIDDAGTEA